MSENPRNEKSEKQFDEKNEKELCKHDEKVEERDALSSIIWAAILIWAGLVFLAANIGWLDQALAGSIFARYLPRGLFFIEPGVWSIILLGVGAILLFEVAIRLAVPTYRRHVAGTLITAAVFIGIGLGNFFGWDLVWPFILISAGVSVLLGNFLRRA
jgi:hypothetical protein